MRRAPLPVISIGNIVVGGTGKTPVTGWVVRALRDAGVRPAVLLRGYGDDEAELHRRWCPEALVITQADRARAAAEAADRGAHVAVLDDGFQHRRLARDKDVVLLDPGDPLPDRVLPRGPYREPLEALRRADLVLITRRPGDADPAELADALKRRGIDAHETGLGIVAWTDVYRRAAEAPVGPSLVATGVARPEGVRRTVEAEIGGEVELMAFPDHHAFDERDVARIAEAARGRTLIVTEKDAVKIERFASVLGDVRVPNLGVLASAGAERLARLVSAVAGVPVR